MQQEPSFDNPPPPPPRQLALRFTGSGSEYFRIWIVNLLLTIVTFGIYYPRAKWRRLRYFYGNTLLGEQPLGFHGESAAMVRGFLLVAVLSILYSVAGRFSREAGLVAFAAVAAIWPALIKSSQQFRMANTSWRGLRFGFTGSLTGAYTAWLPLFVIGAVFVVAQPGPDDAPQAMAWVGGLLAVTMLVTLAVLPWLGWRLKKYQHDHYRYGPERSELSARVGSFYGVFFKTAGVFFLGFLVLGLLVGTVVAASVMPLLNAGPGAGKRGAEVATLLGVLGFVVSFLVLRLVPFPYFTSRMQNLLWSRTASAQVSIRSELRFWPLFWLTLKNWLLMLVTLGLYWPFAVVSVARLRLEAVTVTLSVDPDTLASDVRALPGEAAGDAAGDLFGLDIGL